MDVDAALWMLAFNNVLANLNSYTGQYANNYYLYQASDGLCEFIRGNEPSLVAKNDGSSSSDLSTSQMYSISPDLHKTMTTHSSKAFCPTSCITSSIFLTFGLF
ncbi:MAG: hypothetical protein R2795_07430 [Saprospiraceae bacterium]